jgi:hypothetical protein
MKYYIISHIPTGNIFPQVIAKRGQTGLDFESPDKRAPRLWTSLRSAESWLTVYCKGELRSTYREESDTWGTFSFFVGTKPIEGTARNREEYKILPITISNL